MFDTITGLKHGCSENRGRLDDTISRGVVPCNLSGRFFLQLEDMNKEKNLQGKDYGYLLDLLLLVNRYLLFIVSNQRVVVTKLGVPA